MAMGRIVPTEALAWVQDEVFVDPTRNRDDLDGLRASFEGNGDNNRNGEKLQCTEIAVRDQIALLRALLKGNYDRVEEIQSKTHCGPVEIEPLRASLDDYLRSRWGKLPPGQHREIEELLSRAGRAHQSESALAAEIELQQERNAREDF